MLIHQRNLKFRLLINIELKDQVTKPSLTSFWFEDILRFTQTGFLAGQNSKGSAWASRTLARYLHDQVTEPPLQFVLSILRLVFSVILVPIHGNPFESSPSSHILFTNSMECHSSKPNFFSIDARQESKPTPAAFYSFSFLKKPSYPRISARIV